MDNKHILGFVGIAIILVAVGFAIGLSMGDDDGKDAGDGGSSGSETSNRVEYRLELWDNGGMFSYDVSFYSPVEGSFSVYLGSEPVIRPDGKVQGAQWEADTNFHRSYGDYYEDGQDFEYIQANLHLVFSPNIDAVQVRG